MTQGNADPVDRVVLTRPEDANHSLRAALLEARPPRMPATFSDYPLLRIRPRDPGELLDALAAMRASDLVVFVSPRAVSMADAVRPLEEWPEARVAAVGEASGRALAEAGRPADFLPDGSEDSEGLLERLAEVDMRGRTVWIIRGETGRGLLAERLAERGARPVFVPVYRRECIGRSDDTVVARSGPGTVWVVTAPQAIDCLARLAGPADGDRTGLLDSTLVVINERGRDRARELGFRGEIAVAGGPSPAALARAVWAVVGRRLQ
ncbi:MAG: uroporphyrinogen-III synthase [Guyparkeria sp.]|uniref:uroporphyrinogen-III synthase n=1 Tax=Guyparkeria sp. TaxID=2035736 RepID=UPI00397E0D7F